MSTPFAGAPLYRRDLPLDDLALSTLVEGGVCDAKTPLHVPEHFHAGYEIHVIDTGTMTICLPQGVRLEAYGGDIMVVQPGVLHHGAHDMIPASRHVWMVVDPLGRPGGMWTIAESVRMDQILREAGNRVISCDLRSSLRELFRRMRAHDDGALLAAARLRAGCIDLIAEVVQALQGGQARRTQGAAIIRAIGLLCANLAQPLQVEQLAAESGLSPSRFHECFVADTGETPAAYQLRLRCLRAAELLRARSDSPVKAIAASLGFSDQRYFSTCFKRQMGMTPSEFRSTGLEKSH